MYENKKLKNKNINSLLKVFKISKWFYKIKYCNKCKFLYLNYYIIIVKKKI